MHIHSRFSDGVSSVKRILEFVEDKTDLDVIAITDHNTIRGSMLAASLQDRYSFDVVVGEEISTRDGEIIGLFMSDEIRAGLSADETVDKIHEQGGLAIAPHPFAKSVGGIGGTGVGAGKVRSLPVDGYEEFNANPTTPYSNVLSKLLLRDVGKARLGGSDAHTALSIGAGGTRFEGRNAADLKRSIEERSVVPIKFSSWIKEFAVTIGVSPGLALQTRNCKRGIAERLAMANFAADFPHLCKLGPALPKSSI